MAHFITVIGTGYVGLVAGACFADKGYDVCCIDIDEAKINKLRAGHIPIYEPGLKEMVENSIKRQHLTFSTNLEDSYARSTAIFICVGTPEGKDGNPNLNFVWSVAKGIAAVQKKLQDSLPENDFKVVATKSTVPVGTGDRIEAILKEEGVDMEKISVASNPEFLKEGDAINDFVKPDRVVIGAETQRAKDILVEIYTPFTRKNERMLCMDRKSAEVTKYAANSMLALRITFMNQLSSLCERVDADISSVRKGLGSDTRIGTRFLFPGPGYGGSCFPKDVKALISLGRENSFPLTIMEAVDVFNQEQKHLLAQKTKQHFQGQLESRTIGVWGLAFKPETDDVRESPSLYTVKDLLDDGAVVKAYDPEAMETFRRELDHKNLTFCSTMYDAIKGVDALLVMTDWNEFKMPYFEKMLQLMKQPVIFDARNLQSPLKMKEKGFLYFGMGRKKV